MDAKIKPSNLLAGTPGAAAVISRILNTYHARLKADLPQLGAMMARVSEVHGEQHPELRTLESAVTSLIGELGLHMMKEEQILFPAILQIEETVERGTPSGPIHCGSLLHPVRQMEYEHESALHMLQEMRRLTSDYTVPAGACRSYRALYRMLPDFESELAEHIQLENEELHPLAKELESKWRDITLRMVPRG